MLRVQAPGCTQLANVFAFSEEPQTRRNNRDGLHPGMCQPEGGSLATGFGDVRNGGGTEGEETKSVSPNRGQSTLPAELADTDTCGGQRGNRGAAEGTPNLSLGWTRVVRTGQPWGPRNPVYGGTLVSGKRLRPPSVIALPPAPAPVVASVSSLPHREPPAPPEMETYPGQPPHPISAVGAPAP